jgi:hypothetical protein
MILVEGDTAYDTDFVMFYTLYHIFKQDSIQGRGTIKGRGMIKGRHLALYQIFKTTVYTTKYRVGLKTGRRKTGRANFDAFFEITFLLLEFFFKFKLISKGETNI